MANTIDSELKVDLVLKESMRAFKRRVIPITGFATVFRDVQLQGTNVVNVPYYPINTETANDWSATDGYSAETAEISYKAVTVNKRKWSSLSITSDEAARQPVLDPVKLGTMIGERLAEEIVEDIFSVITAANYGAAGWSGAANTFDRDDVIDLRTACNQAHWPQVGRSLIVDSAYDGNLVKDLADFGSSGDATLWREGRLARVVGFDYFESPLVPDNSEHLIGVACHNSALAIAFSPITPTAAVRAMMVDYRTYTDPDTGLTLEYRHMADAFKDYELRVIEANYGYAKCNTDALKRLCSQ